MAELPESLDAAIAQARTATQAAISAGYRRLQIEILIPELKPMPAAQQMLMEQPLETWLPTPCKVFFGDAGMGALARRDWQGANFSIYGLGELKARIESTDQSFVMVAPEPVDVQEVEQLCNQAGDRPFILFNPRLEDVSIVGIGYTARQLRERFLNTFESCYYLRPMDQIAVLRCYPTPWQVWLENQNTYCLIGEELLKPNSETLDQLFRQATRTNRPKNVWVDLQQFLRSLSN
jgi:hypothetical protein